MCSISAELFDFQQSTDLEMEGSENDVEIADDEVHHEHNEEPMENDHLNNIISGNDDCIPKPGMEFSTEKELRSYYNNYAKQVGFGIIKTSTKNSSDGKPRYFSLCCARYGKTVSRKNSFRPRPSIKTGCKAKINITIYEEKFMITGVNLEHNHELMPGSANLFRCNKVVTSPFKKQLEINDLAGIPLSKNFHSIAVEHGYENLSFGEREARNYIAKAREARLGVGDAQALVAYFQKIQARNSDFFYAIDTDDECRIRNVFWADSRCKAAYDSFGDAITFDTTYLTNRHDMPFAPFVGVNHHGHSILFGCGLLSSEDTTSFIWLFRSWLTCMSGRSPNAIITDQCAAMKAAIAQVFPESHHRWCLWHIMKKVPIKLGGLTEYDDIKKILKRIVYQSLHVEEFEEKWAKMITDFDLGANEWLATLYEDRHRWVPVFVKHIFWAGMSTTQRSESMNAFFDGYVNSQTTLKQFVEQYDHALKSKMRKERDADFASLNSLIPTITNFPIEKQFQNVYTNDIFKKFQDELRGLIYCNVATLDTEGSIFRFKVTESIVVKDGKDGTYWKEVDHEVVYNNLEHSIECICHMFEYRGILCRHAIAVFINQKVNEVPSHYILKRWRKDIERAYSRMTNVYDDCNNKQQRIRSCKLRPLLFELQQLGEQSDENCNSLIEILESAKGKLLATKSGEANIRDNEDSQTAVQESNENGKENSEKKFLTPLKVRRKGRPPSNRKQSKEEKLGNGRKKVSESQGTQEKYMDQGKPKAKRKKVSSKKGADISEHASPSRDYPAVDQFDDCYVPTHANEYNDVEQNQNFGSHGSLPDFSLNGDDRLEGMTTLLGSHRQLQFY